MNFDRTHIEKQLHDKKSSRITHRIGLVLLRVFLILLIFLVIVGGAAGYGIIRGLAESAPSIETLSVAPSESATYIYNTDGAQMQKLAESTSNRTLVTIDQVPLDMQHAIVAIEDERFYDHNGIDMKGIIRAGIKGITSGNFSEGASTITQQLIKNNVFTNWMYETSLMERFQRKFQEQYLALELEKTMSKDQILENYLNTINLGAGAYGVQAAAKRYFNKNASELTLSECAVIAGITQNPTAYNPITYPENNKERRDTVLDKMFEQGYITQEQLNEALADDVYSRIQNTAQETGTTSIYSYYVDALIDQVMEDLQTEKGYTELQAYKLLYAGGLKIYSNQDENIQQICNEEFANSANYPEDTKIGLDYALSLQDSEGNITNYSTQMMTAWFQNQNTDFQMMFSTEDDAKAAAEQYKNAMISESGGDTVLAERISLMPEPQASVVILDNTTGYVKAIVGGRGNKEASLTLNRATGIERQPGSTFKILTTYAPALDAKDMTLATTFDNEPYAYSNGVEVNNWAGENSYTGLTTIRDAIAGSVNVVAVKCLTDITPRLGFEYAEKFGITTLIDDDALDVRQPLALGGITNGVTNIELADAYATIANGGQYNAAKFYSRIEDAQGNILIDNTPASTTVISDTTAFLLTKAMEDVVTIGTGHQIDLGDQPVAGKTGTTSDDRDVWFAGFTPYYTCSIWGGYDNNAVLPSGSTSYHKTLWNAIMNRIHSNLEIKDFAQPEGITTAVVCKKSGKLAVDGVCNNDPRGSMTYTEYFAAGTEPTETCDVHVALNICNETGLIATDSCTSTTRIFVKRPNGSNGTTDDSQYAPPIQTCKGHTVIDNIKDILNLDEDTTTIDDPSGNTTQDDDNTTSDEETPPAITVIPGSE